MSNVRAMFDRIAPRYDLANRMMSAGFDQRWRRRAIARLGIKPGDKLLDLACGTGDGSTYMHSVMPDAKVIGLDFSRGMLDRFSTGGTHLLVQADARYMPLGTKTVQAAFCGFGLRNVPQVELAIVELYRVLAPGGKLVVLEFFRTNRNAGKRQTRWLVDGVAAVVGGFVSGDRSAYRYLADSVRRFATAGEFEAMLIHAGFTSVKSEGLFPQGVATIVEAVRP